ncbi:uncharacterized protein J3R85_000260 [Psidium guajava]|nr:uncharacterized protein J3R85_000260 [Psidium guajava]
MSVAFANLGEDSPNRARVSIALANLGEGCPNRPWALELLCFM